MFFKAVSLLPLSTILATLASVNAAPAFLARHEGHDDAATANSAAEASGGFQKQNALDAQKLNTQFAAIKSTDACQDGSNGCIEGSFAQCVAGKWALTQCAAGTSCFALPLVNKAGTSLVCDTEADATQRFTDAGVTGGTGGSSGTGTVATAPSAPDLDEDDCDEDDVNGTDEDDCDDDQVSSTGGDVRVATTASSPTSSTGDAVTVTKTVTLLPSTATAKNVAFTSIALARRQLFSTVPTSSSISIVATAVVPIAGAPSGSATSSTATSIIGAPTALPTSSGGVVTPTVVVGNDGIVTVTVVSVSTVTVQATDCAASTTTAPVLSNSASTAVVASEVPSPSTIVPIFGVPTASSAISSIVVGSSVLNTATAIATTSKSAIATLVAANEPTVATSSSTSTSTSEPTITDTPTTTLSPSDLSFLLTATIGQ